MSRLFFFSLTGRSEERIKFVEKFLREIRLFRNYNNPEEDPVFSQVGEG